MSMTEDERKQIQLAAKAANIESLAMVGAGGYPRRVGDAVVIDEWNPIKHYEDAIELAALAHLTIAFGKGSVCISSGNYTLAEDMSKNPHESVRRAIVRAAAEIAQRGNS